MADKDKSKPAFEIMVGSRSIKIFANGNVEGLEALADLDTPVVFINRIPVLVETALAQAHEMLVSPIQDANHLVIAAMELPPQQQYEIAARLAVPLGYRIVLARAPSRKEPSLQPFPVGL